jgi:hypothetical protein
MEDAINAIMTILDRLQMPLVWHLVRMGSMEIAIKHLASFAILVVKLVKMVQELIVNHVFLVSIYWPLLV